MAAPGTPAPRPAQGAARPQANPARPQGAANRPRPQKEVQPGRALRRHSAYMPFAVACVCALALGVVLQLLMPNGFSLGGGDANDAVVAVAEIHASSTVQINEVMTSNSRLLRDAADNAPDWIEVRNASAEPVNLAGWTLARTAEENHMFVFPDRVLAPGECALVYADSTYADAEGGYHAPFSLKAAGDTLMLFNPSGVAVEAVNIPALSKNTVYRRVGDVWEVSAEYTPGLENTSENHQSMFTAMTASDVVISEVMASNTRTLQAEDGMYYDYIELANLSGADVDIGGFYLSDDVLESAAWRIPQTDMCFSTPPGSTKARTPASALPLKARKPCSPTGWGRCSALRNMIFWRTTRHIPAAPTAAIPPICRLRRARRTNKGNSIGADGSSCASASVFLELFPEPCVQQLR